MSDLQTIIKKRRISGMFLILLLAWIVIFTLFIKIFSDVSVFVFLQPFSVFETFLHLWTDTSWLIVFILSLLPVFGWLLMYKSFKIGRWLILIPQWITLASAAVITPLHIFNDFGFINATCGIVQSDLLMTVLCSIPEIVYPIIVIILTDKWKPYIIK